ncbi:hypothetical protein EX30DRAFT_127153 [Ascodesmis nigricans]|uniref:Uncharacterized protein n=1 Tax=Ascodesmis nigricans TaxID=341454 RepID=A0A4S2MNQ1_9PEZI|nr:hypothetical protein EX30DRAFT_127153 [Ascodesmis nigricans]
MTSPDPVVPCSIIAPIMAKPDSGFQIAHFPPKEESPQYSITMIIPFILPHSRAADLCVSTPSRSGSWVSKELSQV